MSNGSDKKPGANGGTPPVILIPGKEHPGPPSELPVLILTNQVVFPMAVVPIHVTDKSELRLVDDAAKGSRFLAIVTRSDKAMAREQKPTIGKAYDVGCVCQILQLQHVPDGSANLLLQSLHRFRMAGVVKRRPYPVVRVQVITPPTYDPKELAPLATTVKNQMIRLIALSPNMPDEAAALIEGVEDPGFLADLVTSNLAIPIDEKQKLLETLECKDRLERLIYLLAHQLEILELSDKIQNDVRSSIDKSQREYFLRMQLKAIQTELGETGDQRPELAGYREKIETLGLGEEERAEALRELDRLEKMHESSAEYHVVLSYLDWIGDLPWSHVTEDHLDLARAEAVLDEDHHGLEKVKKRIIEYLAVRKLKPDAPGPILCFAGPPGVGKTSLGQSIARTMGRSFVRMSLGGMHDEAEIRGHRKTYVGAMPGRIIQGIRKAGSLNPVFMLDEIDKVGADFRGDPSSALLEVLDPAQNATFSDLYLNVPFDLSRVLFIATANMLDTIPWALRDRMEIIEIAGYTLEEKLEIARKYLVPRQREAHGLTAGKITFTAAALRRIINEYTREAGVRNLEREIAAICRGAAATVARGRRKPVRVGVEQVSAYLGNQKVYQEVAERTSIPGVVTGLAWSAVGGGILFIEATRMPGTGKLVITGQLGDVMRESAQTVISYVRANAGQYGIAPDVFKESDLHIHVPSGAVPKDGPSAGVAILTAVVSLLTGKKVKGRLAMTGEITLRGLVLPVGGIKEKVMAAARAGITTVVLPDKNRNDLDEVPESVKKRVRFHFAARMDEVLEVALGLPGK
jgi:ATP-dependent Lon protease